MINRISALFVLGLAATVSTAFGTGVCPDGSSMSAYLAPGFSCTIGDKLFSGFSYTASGSNPVGASTVVVDTVGPAGSGASISFADIGLRFNASWSATAGQSSDAAIGFDVSVLSGNPQAIEDFGLAQTSGVIAPGVASVAEDGCGGPNCNPVGGQIHVLTFDQGGTNRETEAETLFTPVATVEVVKDISANGGPAGDGGLATISIVQDTFSQTSIPEPLSMGLIGGGLALLGVVRLRRGAKRA